jgi:hypothetical protein
MKNNVFTLKRMQLHKVAAEATVLERELKVTG